MSSSLELFFVEFKRKLDELEARWEQRFSPPGPEQLGAMQHVVADNWGGLFEDHARVVEERVYEPAASPPPMEEQVTVVVPDNWGGLFEQPVHTSDERGHDLTADVVFTELASSVQICIPELEAEPVRLLDFRPVPVEYALSAKPVEPEYISASVKELEAVVVDEKVLPSTGSVVLKAVDAQPHADPLFSERSRVSALDRDSLAQGALSAVRPPRLHQPRPAHTAEERDLSTDVVFAGFASTDQIHIDSGLTSNSVASACSTPVPLVSAVAAASIRERKPEEFLPAEHQHRIQELEEKLQVANIAAREEAFSERVAGMRALARPPRLPVSLFAPELAPDAISDFELSSTASGRVSFRPILHHGDTPKFRLGLSISKAPAHAKAQRHLFNPNQNMVRKLESDLRAWDAEAERVRSFTPAVIITFDLDPRGADHERAYTIYTSDSFHISPVKCALRAIPLGGYDVSLDDDSESGFTHLDAPLDRAFGRDGQAIAADAALRADAVGAAGGGLLPWVAAAGSALTFAEATINDATSPPTTCSTDCLAAGHCFLYGTCYIPFRSTLGLAIVVIQDVAEHNQPRYFTANLAHAYSVDGAAVQLCSATIATHAVQRVSEGIFAQNLVQLRQPWPPPMEFACLGNGVEPSLLFGFQGVMVPKPPWPPPQSNGLSPWLYARWAVKCEVYGVIKRSQQVTSSGLSCASNFVVEFQLPIPKTILQSVVFCDELLKDNSASFQYHNCRKSVLWIQLTSPWLPPIQVSIRDGCTLFHHAVHLECLQGIHLISASAVDIGFIQSTFSGCSCQWVHTDGHILATELHMVNLVIGSELQVCYTNEVLLLVGKVSNGVSLFGPVSDVQEVPVVFGTLAKHIISEILWPPVQFEQADGVQFRCVLFDFAVPWKYMIIPVRFIVVPLVLGTSLLGLVVVNTPQLSYKITVLSAPLKPVNPGSFLDSAEIGTSPGSFTVVVWLSNWLYSHLLWKPPWQLPALVEFTDDALDDVGDDVADEDYEREAEDTTVLAASTVQNAAAPPALPKDTGRQLSKKELKRQVTVQFPWDPGGSELFHRLGGKPNLKKGGMSGTNRCWALWAMVRAYPSLPRW